MVARSPRREFGFAWAPVVVYGLLLASCEPKVGSLPTIQHIAGKAMGTTYSIKYVQSKGPGPAAKIDHELRRFNTVFSTYDPDSEISRFNAHASTEPFPATEEFLEVVGRALDLARRTGGAFDPTVGPLLRLYGFGPGAKKGAPEPTQEQLAATRAKTGWQKLTVGTDGKLTKSIPELELDLNAIAKGTGVDRVAGVLDALRIGSYMVEIGGEVRCRGAKPNGKPWRLGVTQPGGGPGEYAAEVDLVDQAMATSGTYYQFRKFGNKRVHHILDRRTAKNAAGNVISVTVVAKTCELADGLATALMVLGPDDAKQAVAGLGVRVLFLLFEDGAIVKREIDW